MTAREKYWEFYYLTLMITGLGESVKHAMSHVHYLYSYMSYFQISFIGKSIKLVLLYNLVEHKIHFREHRSLHQRNYSSLDCGSRYHQENFIMKLKRITLTSLNKENQITSRLLLFIHAQQCWDLRFYTISLRL